MFETCEKHTIFPSEYKGNDIRKIRTRYIHIHKYFWLFTIIYKQIIHYKSYDESSITLISFFQAIINLLCI